MEEITITEISEKGRGRGALEAGGVIEVPGTIVGDVVSAEMIGRKKKLRLGKLIKVLEGGEGRVEPRCKHFPSCGGCSFQHVPYEKQLEKKQGQVRELFGKWNPKFHPILGMEEPWAYRNKMEYTFSEDRKGNKFLGLIEVNSKGRVLNLTTCHLTPKWFPEAVNAVREWWEGTNLKAFHHSSGSGDLRVLTLREGKNTGEKIVMVTVTGPLRKNILDDLCNALPGLSVVIQVCVAIKGQPTQYFEMTAQGSDHITEKLCGKTFHISPTAFFQPNTSQAEKLYTRALELSGKDHDLVYDLYCGTFTIGTFFAEHAKKVIGIELNPCSVSDAGENIKLNDITNAEVICGDVGKELAKQGGKPSLVIIDPPRTGLFPDALKELIALAPQKICYISCGPKTAARDIEQLISAGYTLEHVQAIDQFPHTPHLEIISILNKSSV